MCRSTTIPMPRHQNLKSILPRHHPLQHYYSARFLFNIQQRVEACWPTSKGMPRSLRLHIDEPVEQRTGPLRMTGRGRTAASLDTKLHLGSESGDYGRRSNNHRDNDHNSCDYVTPFRIQQ
ncbi:hypothetical protein CPB86DRAFT_269602 [Serendipita vermifera]|nr:hypothetical protein CPB86DRAFT_269602 [Serendipita vermifera]